MALHVDHVRLGERKELRAAVPVYAREHGGELWQRRLASHFVWGQAAVPCGDLVAVGGVGCREVRECTDGHADHL